DLFGVDLHVGAGLGLHVLRGVVVELDVAWQVAATGAAALAARAAALAAGAAAGGARAVATVGASVTAARAAVGAAALAAGTAVGAVALAASAAVAVAAAVRAAADGCEADGQKSETQNLCCLHKLFSSGQRTTVSWQPNTTRTLAPGSARTSAQICPHSTICVPSAEYCQPSAPSHCSSP